MKTKLKYLVLRDGEAAAVKHFKERKMLVSKTGLNRQYHFYFGLLGEGRYANSAYAKHPELATTAVKIGVGAKKGLQPDTLSRDELRVLKIYALKQRVSSMRVFEADELGTVDAIPDPSRSRSPSIS